MSDGRWNFPGDDYPPPESVLVAGKEVRPGDRVCLHPGRRSAERQGSLTDALDILLEGRIARVEVIQQDFEPLLQQLHHSYYREGAGYAALKAEEQLEASGMLR